MIKSQNSGVVHLTSKVDYGLFFLVELSNQEKDSPVSLKDFAIKHKMSFSFLQKVAFGLRHAGLIEATRGKIGGYYISKNPKDISLKDVIIALEGPISIIHCLKGSKCKRNSICSIKSHLSEVNHEIDELFESKKLITFMN